MTSAFNQLVFVKAAMAHFITISPAPHTRPDFPGLIQTAGLVSWGSRVIGINFLSFFTELCPTCLQHVVFFTINFWFQRKIMKAFNNIEFNTFSKNMSGRKVCRIIYKTFLFIWFRQVCFYLSIDKTIRHICLIVSRYHIDRLSFSWWSFEQNCRRPQLYSYCKALVWTQEERA